ncbi:MAG: hypothetical protein M3145_08875 [Pseudomonadota bacterium]|nr:hypothetical protein [Pseudomonadota bacterium]
MRSWRGRAGTGPADLGRTHRGTVETGSDEKTNVPGPFVAGDASRLAQFAIVAAEGAMTAFDINTKLIEENLKEGPVPCPQLGGECCRA